MKVLGIETSCDETAVCLIEATAQFGPDFRYKVLGDGLSSQAALHAEYGGVYPNLAKREHVKNLPLMLEKVAQESGGAVPDCIAVTTGPGLEPCLWTGITFAKQLAEKWNVPVVAANHMESHIVISMMQRDQLAAIEFPVLSLLVSGGHTELILSKKFGAYEYLGRTRDDAAGEAFDKIAREMGLPYPGGPQISSLAKEAREKGIAPAASFTPPMLHSKDYDFSFAGLKTEAKKTIDKLSPLSDETRMGLALAVENAIASVLVAKTVRAAEERGVSTVVMGGGVAANAYIRSELEKALEKVGSTLLVCPPEYSTDNAVMIALSGYFHALKKDFTDPEKLVANGSLKLG